MRGIGAEALRIVRAGDAGVDLAGGERHPAQRHRAGGVLRRRQQPGLRVAAFEGEQDRQRFRHHRAVRQDQGRHAAHRVDAAVLGRELRLAVQRHRAQLDRRRRSPPGPSPRWRSRSGGRRRGRMPWPAHAATAGRRRQRKALMPAISAVEARQAVGVAGAGRPACGRRVAAVKVHRPPLEGADHQPHRLVEHGADHRLQQAGAELEVHEEIHLRPLRVRREAPVVVQVAEGAVEVADVDVLGPLQRDLAAEALAEHLEADGEVGHHLLLRARDDAGADAPGQEFRVAAHIRHHVEELLGRVAEDPLLGVGRHQPATAAADGRARFSRAARSSAKSRSAW